MVDSLIFDAQRSSKNRYEVRYKIRNKKFLLGTAIRFAAKFATKTAINIETSIVQRN